MKILSLQVLILVSCLVLQMHGTQSWRLKVVGKYVKGGIESFGEFLSLLRTGTRSSALMLHARDVESRFNTAQNFLSQEVRAVNAKLSRKLNEQEKNENAINDVNNKAERLKQKQDGILREIEGFENHHIHQVVADAYRRARNAAAKSRWAHRRYATGNRPEDALLAVFSLGISELATIRARDQEKRNADRALSHALRQKEILLKHKRELVKRLSTAKREYRSNQKSLWDLEAKKVRMYSENRKLKEEKTYLAKMDGSFKKTLPVIKELFNTAKNMVDETSHMLVMGKFSKLTTLVRAIFQLVETLEKVAKIQGLDLDREEIMQLKNMTKKLQKQFEETKKAWKSIANHQVNINTQTISWDDYDY